MKNNEDLRLKNLEALMGISYKELLDNKIINTNDELQEIAKVLTTIESIIIKLSGITVTRGKKKPVNEKIVEEVASLVLMRPKNTYLPIALNYKNDLVSFLNYMKSSWCYEVSVAHLAIVDMRVMTDAFEAKALDFDHSYIKGNLQ